MEKNRSLYGIWKVTTEGDCEGKSVRQLGIFRGWVDAIALHLGSACCYSLKFMRVDDKVRDYIPTRKQVDVKIEDANIPNMGTVEDYQKIFDDNGRNVFIKPGRWKGHFVISSEAETRAEKAAKILAKLTDEEKEILGLRG